MSPHTPLLIFDRASARAVDQAAINRYHIPGLLLMEHASLELCDHALDLLDVEHGNHDATVVVVCGGGNNGGDGYAVARHLHGVGLGVSILTIGLPRPETDAATNAAICHAIGLPIQPLSEHSSKLNPPDLVIDAIFGTGLDRAVEGPPADAIEWINRRSCPILAVDIPSGLDCDTGEPLGQAVRATRTVSFLGWKRGFLNPASRRFTGEIVVGQIGAPPELLVQCGHPIGQAKTLS